jgi:methyltransferase-like protein/SAM-dependent methyltransferase
VGDSTSYDEVPYESSSFPQTHPDRLATLARLFGLDPAPVHRCRVLELGCAMGANLIPMAFHLPGSEFVGVDASGRQVTEALAAVAELGLSNVRIEHADILDVDRDWGTFDYVICHGVYSWVPEAVQERILSIASENLAPHGVAFVSYNTYPGWHMREMVRHMMRYHAEQFDETSQRIEQARALLDFLGDSVDASSYYGAMLQAELALIGNVRDSYLFHEHLEEVNAPLYFHQFVARATQHGLRYLGEAHFSAMLASGFPATTAETLERISPDIVRAEQYMDFLRNRFFRQTLLCHARHQPKRKLHGSDLRGFLLASPLTPEQTSPDAEAAFSAPDGRRVTTAFPLTRSALDILGEHWPLAVEESSLLAQVSDRVVPGLGRSELEQQWPVVLQDMLHCYSTGTVELRTWQAPFTNRVGAKPQVSRLVALQARHGSMVTNQLHEPVSLDAVGKCLAPVMDGTRDRGALLSHLEEAVKSGALVLHENDRPLTDGGQTREILERALDQALLAFARCAVLVE